MIVLLKADKTLIFVSPKYNDFVDVFSKDSAVKLSEYIRINNHAIYLIEVYQSSYGSLYNLRLVELKNLETYIETNLANGFIWSFKFFVNTFTFFAKKLDKSF